jgi:hypothetical protein
MLINEKYWLIKKEPPWQREPELFEPGAGNVCLKEGKKQTGAGFETKPALFIGFWSMEYSTLSESKFSLKLAQKIT